MDLQKKRIAVVGAGIAGLSLARALAMNGATVEVYEQAPEIADVGAGIQISPNGLRVIDALGLGEDIRRAGYEATRTVLKSHRGQQVAQVDLDPGGYYYLHRSALIACLEAGVRAWGVPVKTGLYVRNIDPRQARLSFVGDSGDDLGESESFELVLAADGLKSAAREILNGAETARFSGQVAWRAIVSTDDPNPQGTVHMGPGCHIVRYPLREGRRNLVAVMEQKAWAEASWSVEGDPSAVRAAFEMFPKDVRSDLAKIERAYKWGLFLNPVAARLSKDRLCLLGDAAHPTLPFLAQGANLALEDAWILTACLLAGETFGAAFDRYDALRRPRVNRVLHLARANARNFHFRPPLQAPAHWILRTAEWMRPGTFTNRVRDVYDYDATNAVTP